MTKRIVKAVLLVLLAVAGCASVLGATNLSEYLHATTRTVTLIGTGVPLSAGKAQSLMASGQLIPSTPAYTLWGLKEEATLSNPNLGRTAEADVIVALGDIDVLVPGAYLPQAGEDGCIIDANSVYELFGDVDVIGQLIRYGDIDYPVVQVVDSIDSLFVIRPADTSDSGFNTITIRNDAQTPPSSVRDFFKTSLGFPCEVADFASLYRISEFCRWLPVLILVLAYLVFLARQGFSKRTDMQYKTLWIILCLTMMLLFVMFVVSNIPKLGDSLPSRWSDFEQWRQLAQARFDALRFLGQMRVTALHAPLFDSFGYSIALSILATLFFLCFVWGLRSVLRPAPRQLLTAGETPGNPTLGRQPLIQGILDKVAHSRMPGNKPGVHSQYTTNRTWGARPSDDKAGGSLWE